MYLNQILLRINYKVIKIWWHEFHLYEAEWRMNISEQDKKQHMKTIQKEEFAKLNQALYNLEDLLTCMGIKEFTLSREKHNMQIDTNAENIDTDLLYTFCKNIEMIHDAKFGQGNRNMCA